MNRVRLVFCIIVREPAFAWLAGELGWRPAGDAQEFSHSTERVWLPDEEGSKVTYVDDQLIYRQYLIVEATPQAVIRIHDSVNARAPLCSRDSVRSMLDEANSDYDPVLGLYVAALIAPPQADPEIFSWIRDGMHHENAEVRRAAYFATTYAGWTDFDPLLAAASEQDPDPEARELAGRALAGLKRNRRSQS